ncbi:hypothetical protein [Planctomycetes bacterium Pan216]
MLPAAIWLAAGLLFLLGGWNRLQTGDSPMQAFAIGLFLIGGGIGWLRGSTSWALILTFGACCSFFYWDWLVFSTIGGVRIRYQSLGY